MMPAERVPSAEIVEALTSENQRLQQEVMGLRQILHQRAEPQLTAIIDALGVVAGMAQQGNPQARQVIASWHRSLRAAEQAGAGIVVVRGLPSNGSVQA